MGRVLIIAGTFMILAGLMVLAAERVGIRLGRLPGDIRIHGRGGTFYFPIVTCIVISVVLSLIGWLIGKR
jgi:hypothetical protein